MAFARLRAIRALWPVVGFAACSSNPLPENSSRVADDAARWAADYGCSQPNAGPAVVRATNYRITRGPHYKPEVGWDACELMFALGMPSKEESQEIEDGHYRSWWYRGYDDVHLVSLTLRPGGARPPERSPWIVAYVGW